jgi:host factor-I protein
MAEDKTAITISLQEHFLNMLRIAGIPITVFLMNGFQLRGVIIAFDKYTVVLDSDGKQQLIYKHAISTIIPMRAVLLEQRNPHADHSEPQE